MLSVLLDQNFMSIFVYENEEREEIYSMIPWNFLTLKESFSCSLYFSNICALSEP